VFQGKAVGLLFYPRIIERRVDILTHVPQSGGIMKKVDVTVGFVVMAKVLLAGKARGVMWRFSVLTIALLVLGGCATGADAALVPHSKDRLSPRSNLEAAPGSGEAEVLFYSKQPEKGSLWYAVYLNGQLVAQVGPDMTEKVIIKNGANKFEVCQTVFYGNRKSAEWIYKGGRNVITCESSSNSITVEIDGGNPYVPALAIVKTASLSRAP
jgi:hypothetical protein